LNTHTDPIPRKLKTLLAALSLGLLALGLASCAAKPGKLVVQAAPETSASPAGCVGENAKPAIDCAKSPSAAFDQNGRLWAVWTQGETVYVNHSNDLGHTFSAAVAVNPVAEPVEASGEARPKIALSKAGAIYVAWTKRLSKPHSGHIRFSRSLDGGKTFTAPVQINSDTSETAHRFESLAVNDRDYIYLAWIDKRDKVAIERSGGGYTGAALYFTYSSDGGRSFHPEKKIADHVCECCRLAMKIEAKKFPVILWRQVFDGQIRDHALTRFTAKDQPGPIQRISNDHWKLDGCPQHGPALSITPQGDYYAAWFTDGDARKGLFVSGSQDHGKTFSPPVGFGHTPQAGHADLLADGQSVHLTWKEFDGKKTVLLTQYSSDGGLSWSAPHALAETAGDSDHPAMLAYQGHHYVAWQTQADGFRLLALGD